MESIFVQVLRASVLLGSLANSSIGQDAALDDGLLRAYQAAVAERGHDAVWQLGGPAGKEGTWVANNREHGFQTVFGAEGIAVIARGDAERPWQFQLALESWGRVDALASVSPATPESSGNRIEYRRGDLIEWYSNEESGLEQGFTLLAPPATEEGRAGTRLELRLRLTGDVQAEASHDRKTLFLRDVCGELLLSYAGLHAWDATGRDLACALALAPGGFSLSIDDELAVYPVTIDPVIATFEAKLLSPYPPPNHHLGLVAIDGDRAAITGGTTDFVYVFARNGGTWSLEQRLTTQCQCFPVWSYFDVDLDGDTLVVSYEDESNFSGWADVFVRSGSEWSIQAVFSRGDPLDEFARDVSIDGDTLALADPGHATRLFTRSGTTWSSQDLTSQPSQGVAVRGDLLAVQLQNADVQMYERSGSSWSVVHTIPLPALGEIALDEEGTLAAADAGDDDAGTDAGAVYVFRRDGTSWVQHAKLLGPNSPAAIYFGKTIDLRNGFLVVGSPHDDDRGSSAGAVHVYRRNGGWTEQAKIVAFDGEAGDVFGWNVSFDRGSLITAAPGDGPGSAYVHLLSDMAQVYCTAKVNSLGCLPEIDFVGTPSATSASPFVISARQILNNKLGVFYYGLAGRAATPFQDGVRCVAGTIKRTGQFSSGGNPPPNDCSGVNSIDFNARIQSGIDPNLVAGVQVNGQFWTRDGGVPSGTGLSDGIEFAIQP